MKKYKKPTVKTKKINFNYFYSRSRSMDSIGLMNENILNLAGSACSSLCFTTGSKVFMASGEEKNIEDVKINDEVFSYNLVGNELVGNKVVKVIEQIYDKGYLIINDTYKPTPNHPFWVVNHKEWKRADEIMIGDDLLDYKDKTVKVKKIEKVNGSYTVYNLHLKDKEHNFFVEKTLVHNATGICD